MSFCSLIKGITPKIRMVCFVLTNSVLLNLSCVWIAFSYSNPREEETDAKTLSGCCWLYPPSAKFSQRFGADRWEGGGEGEVEEGRGLM